MSAKGRKGKQVEEGEFYPTPRDVILALLTSDLVDLPGGTWIEPCAGTGRIISTINEHRDDVSWIAVELFERFGQFLEPLIRDQDVLEDYGDFVHRDWPYDKADVLIMNPPFSLTFQFVKAALERANWVVCLQRQGWFGTKDRSPWLRDHCPDSLQLPWRPSFRPDGSTDSCEYCWFIWPPGSSEGRRSGMLAMLDKPNTGQQSLFG